MEHRIGLEALYASVDESCRNGQLHHRYGPDFHAECRLGEKPEHSVAEGARLQRLAIFDDHQRLAVLIEGQRRGALRGVLRQWWGTRRLLSQVPHYGTAGVAGHQPSSTGMHDDRLDGATFRIERRTALLSRCGITPPHARDVVAL